jgi:hypothetical protein
MKDSFNCARNMAMANIPMQMDPLTKASGIMIKKEEKENRYTATEMFLKECLMKTARKDLPNGVSGILKDS